MSKIANDRYEQVPVQSPEALRSWLESNHQQSESVWLVTWKKVKPEFYVSRFDVLDELISFGWIDGIRRKLDEERTMQLISPRQAQHWTESYRKRANKLVEEGRMHSAGLAKLVADKKSGHWNDMDEVDALLVPDDLTSALQKTTEGKENFLSAAPSYRRNVLRWISMAKKPETRQRRIDKTVEYAQANKKVPQM